ncbi:hypothetical protein BDV29DRAFT_57095 [Aspergillus leporis]|uniref:Uncharacterized protein n=1 Tax=Aspergillus leporis TaxID=41062 RepID=A0A5N5WPS2_9EURO|nr:hypothetical protein BDV29DRAFT_57095 [Aspergillus leporis]
MVYEQITENVQGVVTRIKGLIKQKPIIGQKKPGGGWEYTGDELASETSNLANELNNDDYKCNVLHLIQGGTIQNPTGHVLIIPLNGTASFERDEPILPCHYIEQERTIFGANLDLIIVALEKKPSIV